MENQFHTREKAGENNSIYQKDDAFKKVLRDKYLNGW